MMDNVTSNLTPQTETSPKKMVRIVLPAEMGGGPFSPMAAKTKFSNSCGSSSQPESPRKRTCRQLSNHLEAEVKRRCSLGLNSSGISPDDNNHINLISSLRRQNEDLKAKIANLSTTDSQQEGGVYAKRCQELEVQLAKLERLLNVERQEFSAKEEKVLALMNEMKTKWQGREDTQVKMLMADLAAANKVVADMEVKIHHSDSSNNALTAENDELKVVKEGLKKKVKEYKSKLEIMLTKYANKAEEVSQLQEQLAAEKEAVTALSSDREAKVQECAAMRHKNEDLKVAKEQVTTLQARLRDLETRTTGLEQDKKSLSFKLRQKEDLERNWEQQRCHGDKELQELRRQNESLQDDKVSLEEQLMARDAKLKQLEADLQSVTSCKESLSVTDEKIKEMTKKNHQLHQDNSLLKVELRIAERKVGEHKDHISLLRRMHTEEKNKASELEKQLGLVSEARDQSDSQKSELQRDKQQLMEQLAELQERTAKELEQTEQLREEADKASRLSTQCQSMAAEIKTLKSQVADRAKLEEQSQKTSRVLSDLTELNCSLEAVVEKLRDQKRGLLQENQSIRDKLCVAEAECIKSRSEINELKSLLAFKESQLQCAEEKSQDCESLFEKERQMWKTKCQDLTEANEQVLMEVQQLRYHVGQLDKDLVNASEDNVKLHDQNTKLKEELTTLITSVQSLKESNLMLQDTIKQFADKLARRDATINQLNTLVNDMQDNLDKTNQEHAITMEQLEQLKKLAQHMPNGATGQGKKR